jgi:type II secretory pathway component GspD/PulD (secretin)
VNYTLIKILGCFLLFVSCSGIEDKHDVDFFESVYKPIIGTEKTKASTDLESKRLSFSAKGMKINDFAIWFSKEFGKGIIYSSAHNDKLIYAELREASQQEICNAVARHLNTGMVDLGNTFFIGELSLNDVGVYVKRVKGVKIEDLRKVVANLTSEKSVEGYVTDDGIVVVIDTESSLLAYSRAFDVLESLDSGAWVVQLYMFDFKKSQLKEFGIDLTGSGNLAVRFLQDSIGGFPQSVADHTFNSEFVLEGLINVARHSDQVSIVSQPLFVMRDGSDFNFENTESIPQVKRVVSGEGTVSDSDVNFIDVGLKINVKLRELSRGALLNLKVSNERIIELTPEGFPRINRTSVSSETPLNSTGVYLVAQTSYEEVSKGKVTFGFSDKKSTSTLQIFARVFKLDSKFQGLAKSK